MAIAGMQGLLEAASLAATGRAGVALGADAAGLADVEDWDAPPPALNDGARLRHTLHVVIAVGLLGGPPNCRDSVLDEKPSASGSGAHWRCTE